LGLQQAWSLWKMTGIKPLKEKSNYIQQSA